MAPDGTSLVPHSTGRRHQLWVDGGTRAELLLGLWAEPRPRAELEMGDAGPLRFTYETSDAMTAAVGWYRCCGPGRRSMGESVTVDGPCDRQWKRPRGQMTEATCCRERQS